MHEISTRFNILLANFRTYKICISLCVYLLLYLFLCRAVTKGPSIGIVISKKIRLYKAIQNFSHVNLLINIVYYVYIDLYIHIYTPNQVIRVAKVMLFKKKTHAC